LFNKTYSLPQRTWRLSVSVPVHNHVNFGIIVLTARETSEKRNVS